MGKFPKKIYLYFCRENSFMYAIKNACKNVYVLSSNSPKEKRFFVCTIYKF